MFIDSHPPFVGNSIPLIENQFTSPAIRYIFASSNTKNQKKMKTTTIIIAAVLSLNVNLLMADNTGRTNLINNEYSNLSVNILEPTTPEEADFSDIVPEPIVSLPILTPVTPAEADFNDYAAEETITNIDLAPETPSTADFDENESDTAFLSPVTPSEADFE